MNIGLQNLVVKVSKGDLRDFMKYFHVFLSHFSSLPLDQGHTCTDLVGAAIQPVTASDVTGDSVLTDVCVCYSHGKHLLGSLWGPWLAQDPVARELEKT